jgi:Ca-activated chloride channel family protein
MKDKVESTLKNLQAPAPDPEARLRAKRAALAEFERAQASNQSPIERAGPLQALWRRLRPSREHSHGSTSMKWFTNRGLLAGAAGLCVVAVGLAIVLPNLSQFGGDVGEAAQLESHASQLAQPGEDAANDVDAPADAAAAAGPAAAAAATAPTPAPLEAQLPEPRPSLAPPPPGAQSLEPELAKARMEAERSKELDGITVTGLRANLRTAQETKRQAFTVVDAIVSEDIGRLPDSSVAGSLQRIPGVSTDKDAGLLRQDANDQFEHFEVNPVHRVADQPWSTFSLDVDTASYSFVRAQLHDGYLPQKDAVRAEEMINYFEYAWPAARTRSTPFKPTVVVSDSPWNKGRKLIHIGIKGYDIERENAPDANLVLLLDVSGSMNEPDKLPLVVRSMEMLLDSLKPTDTVAIVVYAGAAGTVLEPTPARQKAKIVEALRSLEAGGSTAGAQGIERAYELAERHFRKGGVNRILLCTDGDFNVGISDTEELKGFVERKRDNGVYLSVLGFGQGNYRDELAQALAQNGNGVAAYIDTEKEARKVLVEQASGSLFTIAKDVKIQVEFEPATVSEYRLIGYETRTLAREDFNNDAVDAGDVGAGHTVTAIYEITPVDAEGSVDEPRYEGNRPKISSRGSRGEYGFLKIRYKLPAESRSRLISEPIPLRSEDVSAPVARDVRFSTAVAGFAQLLRGGKYTGSLNYDDVIRMAQSSRDEDPDGYRAEFIELVRKAKAVQSGD